MTRAAIIGSRRASRSSPSTPSHSQDQLGQPKWGPEHCQIIDGEIDDASVIGMAHLERMDKGGAYLGLYRADGSGYQVWLRATKGRLTISHEEMDARKASTPAIRGGGEINA